MTEQFYEKLQAIYLSDEPDVDRRIKIYNMCILEWQEKLSKEELERRWEPKKHTLGQDGKVKPECIPDFAKKTKKN